MIICESIGWYFDINVVDDIDIYAYGVVESAVYFEVEINGDEKV